MNIKKRLFISNILMIGIPAIIAMLVVFFGILIFLSTVVRGGTLKFTDEREVSQSREFLESLIVNWIENYESDNLENSRLDLEKYIEKNEMLLTIIKEDKEISRVGNIIVETEDILQVALESLGGKGIVSDLVYELYGDVIKIAEKEYQIKIFNYKKQVSEQKIKRDIMYYCAFIMLIVIAVIYFTNRFLTRFVYQKIEQPLDVLAKGVHQIRDGNLEYRIQYNSQDEFKEICADFNDMGTRLKEYVDQEQKNEKNRKVLLASISHDLRSPLTTIRAYVEGLIDGIAKSPEAQLNYLNMIKTKTEEIDQLVTQLFLFSKMEMGDFPYYPEVLDIKKEIEDYLNVSAGMYYKKGLSIKLYDLPNNKKIFVDPTYFHSVLTNLLDNSAKYKDKPKGKVIITSQIIKDTWICIRFDDNGPGVPKEALDKLFEVFYRIDPSRNNTQKGSGLGLAIVRKSVECMGGNIIASNAPSKGLRMNILLPLWKGEEIAKDTDNRG